MFEIGGFSWCHVITGMKKWGEGTGTSMEKRVEQDRAKHTSNWEGGTGYGDICRNVWNAFIAQ